MNIRQTLLLLLFTVLLLSEMFGWRLGVGQGFSVKNAFLYALLLPVLFDFALARNKGSDAGIAIHAGFVVLALAAITSWALTDFDTRMPMYSREERLISIKSSLVDLYLFFLVFCHGPTNVKQAVTLAKALLILVMFANIVTVIDVYDIPDLGVIQQMGSESLANEGRLKGPIGEPNQYAAFLILFLPAYFALAFERSAAWQSRIVYSIGGGITLVSLLLTGSRGGILGVVLGLCWAAWVLREKVAFGRILRTAVVLVPFVAVIVALVSIKYEALLFGRLDATFNTGNAVTASAGRLSIWETGLGVMSRQPESFIAGVGWHSFAPYVGVVPHNTYLGYLFSLGVFGLAVYVFILNRVISVAKTATLIADGEPRALVAAFTVGFLSLLVAVFFVDLFAPWYFIWAYIGISVRLGCLLIKQNKNIREGASAHKHTEARFASLLR